MMEGWRVEVVKGWGGGLARGHKKMEESYIG